jgi:hypothetical protein
MVLDRAMYITANDLHVKGRFMLLLNEFLIDNNYVQSNIILLIMNS